MITTASAVSAVCVRLSEMRVIPSCCARDAARPLSRSWGAWPGARTTSISFQLTPRLMPVPSALAPAYLAANRAAKLWLADFCRARQ